MPGGGRLLAPWSRGRRVDAHVGDRAAWRWETRPVRIPVSGGAAARMAVDRVGGRDRCECLEEEAHRPARYPARGGRKVIAAVRGRGCAARLAVRGALVRLCGCGRALGVSSCAGRHAAGRSGRTVAGARSGRGGAARCVGVAAAGRATIRSPRLRSPLRAPSRSVRRARGRAWRRPGGAVRGARIRRAARRRRARVA
jgi:hypothetical protein